MKIKSFLKKLVPTWKTDEVVRAQNIELLTTLRELLEINKGLNMSVGFLHGQNENLREEAVSLLSAITMQHGGELTIKSEFFDVLTDPSNSNLHLKIERQENKSVILKLEPVEEESESEEE